MVIDVDQNQHKKGCDKPEVKLRILRSYKVSLFNAYCNQILEEVWSDSIKYDLVT